MNNKLEPIKILVFSASLRKASLNKRLTKIAADIIEQNGGEVEFESMKTFDTPSFNQDLEAEGFFPQGAINLKERLLNNDGFIIASPNYNGSIPGVLKNTIDWVSRLKPQPFKGHHAMLMSASPSVAEGNPALWAARIPLEKLGTKVFPRMFSLASPHLAFASEGHLLIETQAKRLVENILEFMQTVQASKNYQVIRKYLQRLQEVETRSIPANYL